MGRAQIISPFGTAKNRSESERMRALMKISLICCQMETADCSLGDDGQRRWKYRVNRIVHWDRSDWISIGGGVKGGVFTEVAAIVLDSHGNLYVGGSFNQTGASSANNIAKWDGSSWDAMGGGVNGAVLSLAIDQQDNLYVGGYFSMAGSVAAKNVARWNGIEWSSLGDGLNGVTNALAVNQNGDLISAGYTPTTTGNQPNLLERWDGQSWEFIGDSSIGYVSFLGFKGDTLYIGTDRVWVFQNGIFTQIGKAFDQTGLPPEIRSITFDQNGKMVAGGMFEKAGDVAANNIARWNGAAWENLGSGANYWGVTSLVNSGDTLYVGGFFFQAGGHMSMYFAQWHDPQYNWLPTIWQ